MVSHEIDFKIFGDDIQFVEIELDPRETVIAEAGAMVYMEDGITFEVKMGDGSTPNQGLMGTLLSAGSRLITGESLFLTHFTNINSCSKDCLTVHFVNIVILCFQSKMELKCK